MSLHVPEAGRRLVWLEWSEGVECKEMELENGRSVGWGEVTIDSWGPLTKKFWFLL